MLADIELTGVKIDTARLAEYGRELTVEMDGPSKGASESSPERPT